MTDKTNHPELSEDTIKQAAEAVLNEENGVEDLPESEIMEENEAAETPTRTKGSSLATLLGGTALLLSLGGIGAGYYLYNQNSTQQHNDANSAATIKESLSTKTADLAAQLDEKFGHVNASVNESAQALQSLDQRQQQLEDNLNLIRSQTNGSKRDWSLAGIQYLIQIAADRLAFMRDRGTAVAALQTAQSRLAKLGDASFEALSRRLNDDIRMLENYQANNPLDALEALGNEISKLAPTPTASQPKVALDTGETQLAENNDASPSLKASLQNSLLKRFRVRHHDQPLNALNKNTIDWQNMSILQLRMEGLKLALQQDNQTAFKHAQVSIRQWVVTHLQAEQQQPILLALDNLTLDNVFPPPPNLEETQSVLRALLHQAGSA